MHGLDKAVEILADANASQNPVLVHGDYDADGVTATALLVMFFREIGLPVLYHLPDRFTDGYGLNHSIVVSLRELPGIGEHSAPVLLTVDCGISNLAEVAAAKALGFRVIVSDHHLPGPDLPAAEAVVNPHQPGCPFPFKQLAGGGVAFYLAAGLRSQLVRRGGGQQLRGGVESVLREIGFEVSLAAGESHLCCGSAGTYSVVQPALDTQLRDRKVEQLAPIAAQAIVSANIGCIQHLQSGTTTPVRHWIEVLDVALAS